MVSYNLIFVNRNIRGSFLLICAFTLLTFVLLFTFRSADDNRLTSWQWVFEGGSGATVFLVLAGCVISACLFPQRFFSLRSPAPALFFISFAFGVFFWREPEVIVDASRYFTQAKHLEVYGCGFFIREWGKAVQVWTDLPLVPFLYGVIFKVLGESRVYIQFFNTIFFSMTVVLTFLIGRDLWDEETGVAGGALLLGMPYLFSQVPLMLVDVPTMFFFTLSVFTFIRGIKHGGWNAAFAVGSLFFAIFSKYSVWPMLSVLAIIIIAHLKRVDPPAPLPREDGRAAGVSVAGRKAVFCRGITIIAVALFIAMGVMLYKYDVFSEQMRLLVQFQKPGLKKWGESFLSTFLFQIHPFITGSALFSIVIALRKRDIRYAVISWLVVLLVVFQVRRIRYTLPVLPMVALMASYGLQYIQDKDVKRLVVLCAVMSSLSVALFGYLPFLQKMSMVNLKTAGEFLNTLKGEKVEVYTLHEQDPVLNPAVAVPLLDLFTRKQIVYRYEPVLPEGEAAKDSALRFTWEYKNPLYYRGEYREKNVPVAVVSGGPYEALPADIGERIRGYRLSREFGVYEGIFGYRSMVTVYEPAPGKNR